MEGPSQKIFNNGGWLCLTDAQRYYTILQFWQVTGSEDGVYPGYLARFSPYLVSYAGRRRDARDPRGICNNLGCTRWRKRSVLVRTLHEILHGAQIVGVNIVNPHFDQFARVQRGESQLLKLPKDFGRHAVDAQLDQLT